MAMEDKEIHSPNSLLFGFPEKDYKIKIIGLPFHVCDFNASNQIMHVYFKLI
ncbi:unnamed protein product [Camellia sinensis]